jgi:hypothetical protein
MTLKTKRLIAFSLLVITVMITLMIGIFYHSYFEQIADLLSKNLWPALIAVATFFGLAIGGVVKDPPKTFNSFLSNIYLQLAVVIIFLCSSALLAYIVTTERSGKLVIRLKSGNTSQLRAILVNNNTSSQREIHIPQTILLPRGNYTVKLSDENYRGYEEETDVAPGESDTVVLIDEVQQPFIQFTLKPKDASITDVTVQFHHISMTNVETKSEIRLPETVLRTEKGAYKIKLADNNFKDWDTVLLVTALSEQNYDIKVNTIKRTGQLTVYSRPDKAELTINNLPKGFTPYNSEAVPLGTYIAEVEKEGYQTARREIVLSAGKPSQIIEISLVKTCKVNFWCENIRTKYEINGKPHEGNKSIRLAKGKYKLLTVPPGKEATTSEIAISSDTTIIIHN